MLTAVDWLQGREKEVMIMSTVRSNDMASLGFLTDWYSVYLLYWYKGTNTGTCCCRRRLLVAVTSVRST
jgi:hypothetical protein